MNKSKVLATVNGKEITEDIVLKFLNDLGPQVAMQFQSPEGMKKVVEELINQEVLYLDAIEQKLDEEEAFNQQLEILKEGLVKQYAVNKMLADVTVKEEEIKEFYKKNKEQFKKPESAVASHILVDTEEKANEVLKEIENGETFEDIAKKYSSCPSKDQGGNLGEFTRGKMIPEFEEVAFSMEIGAISKPVKTKFGYHIIKLVDKKEESESNFEEVKEQISQQLLAMKQQEVYINKTNELKQNYEVKNNM